MYLGFELVKLTSLDTLSAEMRVGQINLGIKLTKVAISLVVSG